MTQNIENVDLFSPCKLGPLELPNRVVMAPMTRNRAGPGEVPGALAVTYYAQRASAGLIITEGTQISPEGQGYPGTPGIFSPEQIAGWKRVTDAVHAAGGRIFAQLWHVGRISHPSLQPGGALPVAPSALQPPGQTMTAQGMQPFVMPRALETHEIAARRGRLSPRRGQCQACRLRRRRAAWRQRLSGRPIPARQDQPAHGPLWRQRDQSRALSDRSDRGAGRRMGRRPRRRAASPRPIRSTTSPTAIRPQPSGLRSASSSVSASPISTSSSRCRATRSPPASGLTSNSSGGFGREH